MSANFLAVRGIGVTFYALRDGPLLYLIDSGFVGGAHFLRLALRHRDWDRLRLAGILLTHGHLDHTLNAADLAARTGAWIAAHSQEREQLLGRYAHTGAARVCGALEAAGRTIFRSKPVEPERWLTDGEDLPILGGLRVVHLPGHTDGHVGFLHLDTGVLFSGDLFANFPLLSHRPPRILNSRPAEIPGSIARVRRLKPGGLLPNHGDGASPQKHLERFLRLTSCIDEIDIQS